MHDEPGTAARCMFLLDEGRKTEDECPSPGVEDVGQKTRDGLCRTENGGDAQRAPGRPRRIRFWCGRRPSSPAGDHTRNMHNIMRDLLLDVCALAMIRV